MERRVITPEGLCAPPEPYSYGIQVGPTLYMAGQVALNRDGRVVGSTVTEQAEQVWSNIRLTVESAGGTLADIVKLTYYMKDIRQLPEEIVVRERLFGDGPLPCVTALQAASLGLPELLLEVDATAVLR